MRSPFGLPFSPLPREGVCLGGMGNTRCACGARRVAYVNVRGGVSVGCGCEYGVVGVNSGVGVKSYFRRGRCECGQRDSGNAVVRGSAWHTWECVAVSEWPFGGHGAWDGGGRERASV